MSSHSFDTCTWYEEGRKAQLYEYGKKLHAQTLVVSLTHKKDRNDYFMWVLTQDAGEVAEGVEASVSYGIHHSETLVSANNQPEAEERYSYRFNHLSQPIGTKWEWWLTFPRSCCTALKTQWAAHSLHCPYYYSNSYSAGSVETQAGYPSAPLEGPNWQVAVWWQTEEGWMCSPRLLAWHTDHCWCRCPETVNWSN